MQRYCADCLPLSTLAIIELQASLSWFYEFMHYNTIKILAH